MKPISHFLNFSLLAVLTGAAFGCTDSSLFDDEIAVPPNELQGQVELLGESSHHGVYVWLDGFNISTRTDSAGNFRLPVPRTLTETANGGITGSFTLYFFVSNFTLGRASVFFRNGQIVRDEGDIAPNGKLDEMIHLFKELKVFTFVEPRAVPIDYGGPIHVQLTLQATLDSITVIFPKSVGGLLGGLFFRHQETGEIFLDIPDVGADTREFVEIGRDGVSRRGVFQLNGTNFRDLYLPKGNYEVIPFFFIDDPLMPAALLPSLGANVEEPHPDYLQIPFRREGGQFTVN